MQLQNLPINKQNRTQQPHRAWCCKLAHTPLLMVLFCFQCLVNQTNMQGCQKLLHCPVFVLKQQCLLVVLLCGRRPLATAPAPEPSPAHKPPPLHGTDRRALCSHSTSQPRRFRGVPRVDGRTRRLHRVTWASRQVVPRPTLQPCPRLCTHTLWSWAWL